jgi:serine/threonine protein kinase
MSYHTGKNVRDYYDLEQELGRGAFAIVCKAVNKSTGENVAIKIFDK